MKHFNLTNKANILTSAPNQSDNISISDCNWYINRTLVTTAGNSSFLNSPNVTNNANITYSCRINNGFGETAWTYYVNSSQATAGDSTAPSLSAQAINGNSFTTEQRINVTVNCTDNVAVSSVKVEWNRTGAFANYTMTLLN